jgi:hypothetical protein
MGKQKLITHYPSDLYRQMSGGERHYIRVRRIVPLRLGAERNSTLQSVGIRSHLLWIHHRYRCKNFRHFLVSFILILIEFFILSFFCSGIWCVTGGGWPQYRNLPTCWALLLLARCSASCQTGNNKTGPVISWIAWGYFPLVIKTLKVRSLESVGSNWSTSDGLRHRLRVRPELLSLRCASFPHRSERQRSIHDWFRLE